MSKNLHFIPSSTPSFISGPAKTVSPPPPPSLLLYTKRVLYIHLPSLIVSCSDRFRFIPLRRVVVLSAIICMITTIPLLFLLPPIPLRNQSSRLGDRVIDKTPYARLRLPSLPPFSLGFALCLCSRPACPPNSVAPEVLKIEINGVIKSVVIKKVFKVFCGGNNVGVKV